MQKEKHPQYSRLANHQLAATPVSRISESIGKLPIPTSYGFDYVWVDEIIYCEAEASYTCFYLNGGSKIMASKNIGEFETVLSAYRFFFRAHKSHIINLIHVTRYNKEDGGYAVMDNGKELIIAKRQKDEFMSLFFDR